ncbi:MAG: class I SAM-dependent methyltransferase [Actinobacteria bacterium]|nr:class I SAM-dependent methyltransferase [Actinomycetota bacterium]
MSAGRRDSIARPAGDLNQSAQSLFSGLPSRYDLLGEVLSFGQNARWRRAVVDRITIGAPGHVLDVATGTAGVALQIARRTPAVVTGADLTSAMLVRGQANVDRLGAGSRVRLLAARAEQLPFADSSFDALSFTYLFRYVADPAATLRELARVVRPGGVIATLEFGVPPRRLSRAVWWLYTRTLLPIIGGALGGPEWWRVGRFLGPSISAHYERYPIEWQVDAWRAAGIEDVGIRRMSLGVGLIMWGVKAGARGRLGGTAEQDGR